MYYETDHLSHHGVKGQKWGVRRYQNKDGTLTAEGKKRQSDTNKKVPDPEKKHTVTSETALNHVTDYLDNKMTEPDSKKLEALWDNGNETFMKWYDNKDDSLKEQYKKDRDAAFEAYEKKSLEILSKIIKENGNKELSDAIDKHYDSENPYDLYKSLLNENESLAKSFDAYSTMFDIMVDSYMANKKDNIHHEGVEETDYLSHYGVVGMKWGVRRYQNKDGTLTEAGKKHQVDTDSESTKMKKDVKDAYDKIAKEFNKYQDILGGTRFETMDDDELRELVIMDIKEAHGVDLSDLYEDYIKKRNKTLSHSEDDHLEHRYHKYIKKYWVDGKWRYVYADKGDHQKLESYASDYKNYSKIARSTTDSYRRRTQWETKARESENKFIYLMNKRSIKTITKKEIEVGRSYLTNLLKKIGNRII